MKSKAVNSRNETYRQLLPLLALALPAAAFAQTYTYTNVASIAASTAGVTLSASRAYALNSSGAIVGDYTASGNTIFFTLAPGAKTITPFATVNGTTLNYDSASPNAGHQINDSGNYLAELGVSPIDGTGIGGTYIPASSTFTQYPISTTYQTANQIATGLQPFAINSSHNAVGLQFFETDPTSAFPSSNYHGVFYNASTNTTVDIGGTVPGSGGDAINGGSILRGISDNNSIVGEAQVPNGSRSRTDAILGVANGSGGFNISDLSSLISAKAPTGFTYVGSTATNISANGRYVVGTYTASSGGRTFTRGFEITDGTAAVDLGTLGSTTTTQLVVTSVNDSGVAAGFAPASSGASHAFIYSGTLMDLSAVVPNITLSQIGNINDAGQLVGYANASSAGGTQFSAFLLTPVPEPSTLVLSLVGGAALLRRRSGFNRSR